MNRYQLICDSIELYVKDNPKYVSKQKHVFHAPDNHSNQEVNVDVISNIMPFLM